MLACPPARNSSCANHVKKVCTRSLFLDGRRTMLDKVSRDRSSNCLPLSPDKISRNTVPVLGFSYLPLISTTLPVNIFDFVTTWLVLPLNGQHPLRPRSFRSISFCPLILHLKSSKLNYTFFLFWSIPKQKIVVLLGPSDKIDR